MTIYRNVAHAVAAAALLTSLPGAAAAKQKSAVVEYGDLNLALAKDRAALERRVDRTIARMCRKNAIGLDRTQAELVQKCVAEANSSSAIQRARAEAGAARRLAEAPVAAARN